MNYNLHQELLTTLRQMRNECERIGVMAKSEYLALLADVHSVINRMEGPGVAAVSATTPVEAPAPAAPQPAAQAETPAPAADQSAPPPEPPAAA